MSEPVEPLSEAFDERPRPTFRPLARWLLSVRDRLDQRFQAGAADGGGPQVVRGSRAQEFEPGCRYWCSVSRPRKQAPARLDDRRAELRRLPLFTVNTLEL
jgi:hypothetical protein